ncbi:MAG TPA: M20/M25/M40 family metallo-hydrolase [Planctomycetota bacterium]|nr:M20/M25/M40 family metallo-hydrolase [Planctomycetota bacterium]
MKMTLLVAAAFWGSCWNVWAQDLEKDVRTLASEDFEGRETGTDGEAKAAKHIVAQLRQAGLEPVLQVFEGHGTAGRNVVAVIHGSTEESVILGAHYDHLGGDGKKVYCGADDNASGTAVVLELARRFAKHPTKRTLVLIAFSGEEMGVLGSRYYVNHPVVAETPVAMINMDMVGRLRESLIVFGADTGDKFKEYLSDSPIKIAYNKEAVGPSDHTSFVLKGIPAVHLFTGAHADYHKPGDTADKVNFDGLRRVADLVETLTRRVGDAPERMAFVKPPPSAQLPRAGKGGTPYFGVMPDYGYDGKGVKLQGVAPGSPAEKAGLKEGDLLLSLNGRDFEDIKAYSAIFFGLKPGDEITLGYEREGKRSSVKATLLVKSQNRSDE